MLKHLFRYLCIFAVMCSPLSGCSEFMDDTVQSVCSSVNVLQSVDLDTLNLESLPGWVAENYSVPEADLLAYEYNDNSIKGIQWEYDGRVYAAFFDKRSLRSIAIRPVLNDIKVHQVMECFGSPDFYGAYVVLGDQERSYELHLWYPDIGVIARYSMVDVTGNSPPVIDENTLVDVIVFRPNSLSKAIVDAYIPGSENLPPEWPQLIRAWPGSWEGMEFTELSR